MLLLVMLGPILRLRTPIWPNIMLRESGVELDGRIKFIDPAIHVRYAETPLK